MTIQHEARAMTRDEAAAAYRAIGEKYAADKDWPAYCKARNALKQFRFVVSNGRGKTHAVHAICKDDVSHPYCGSINWSRTVVHADDTPVTCLKCNPPSGDELRGVA